MPKKDPRINRHNLRPPFCYDKDCHLIYTSYDPENFKRGFSFFCFGKLKKPHLFIEHEAKHLNDISHCYYTPLKGMIRFFVNIGDLWGEINAKLAVMNKLEPLGNCYKCKKELYRMVKSCIVLTKKKKICYECKSGSLFRAQPHLRIAGDPG